MKKQALLLAGLLAVGGFAAAQGPGPRGGQQRGPRPGGPGLEQLQQELGLTDAQMDQLRKLQVEQQKADVQRRASLHVAQLEMNELFRAATVDERAVAAKLRQLTDLEAAALKSRVDARLSLRKVVSSEQAERLERIILRARRGGQGQGGEGRGEGPRHPRNPRNPEGRGGSGPGGPGSGPEGSPEPEAR